jgi:hypothetical protein
MWSGRGRSGAPPAFGLDRDARNGAQVAQERRTRPGPDGRKGAEPHTVLKSGPVG